MMDKVEPPIIPDGYGISVAYATFLDIVRSLSQIIEKRDQQSPQTDRSSRNFSKTESKILDESKKHSSYCTDTLKIRQIALTMVVNVTWWRINCVHVN